MAPLDEPGLAGVALAAYLLGVGLVLSPFVVPTAATLSTLALVGVSWLLALGVWVYRAVRVADEGRTLTLPVVAAGVALTVLAGNLGPRALELSGLALVVVGLAGGVVGWLARRRS